MIKNHSCVDKVDDLIVETSNLPDSSHSTRDRTASPPKAPLPPPLPLAIRFARLTPHKRKCPSLKATSGGAGEAMSDECSINRK